MLGQTFTHVLRIDFLELPEIAEAFVGSLAAHMYVAASGSNIGLFNHMLGLSYKMIKQQGYEYKGFIAENFVQQEFAAQGLDPTYSWGDARAEIEFIVTDDDGNIILNMLLVSI